MLARALLLLTLLTIAAAASAPCTCATDRLTNGWCSACEVGYVAGIEVRSAALHEALDAHGHEFDPASIDCPTCREVMGCDGYCVSCRRGFVGGALYFSKLTYLVALGERVEVDELECPVCRASAACRRADGEGLAWCAACGRGVIGNVSFTDRGRFDAGVKEIKRLLASIETSRRCEYCGVAQFMDARCPRCRISYRNGRPVDRTPARPGGP